MSEDVPVETVVVEAVPDAPVERVPVSDVITFESILKEHEVVVQKETELKSFFTDLAASTPSAFKPRLIDWANTGFRDAYPIWTTGIDVPNVCSDGVMRTIEPYIEYCIGMKISDLVSSLQSKFVGIQIGYTVQANIFSIVVLKV